MILGHEVGTTVPGADKCTVCGRECSKTACMWWNNKETLCSVQKNLDKLIECLVYDEDDRIEWRYIENYIHSKIKSARGQNSKILSWVYDFVASNSERFDGREASGEVWGEISGEHIYIVKSVFNDKMKAAGFDPQSFLSWAQRKGLIATDAASDRKTKNKRIKGSGVVSRCVCLIQNATLEDADVDELPF